MKKKIIPFCFLLIFASGILKAQITNNWHFCSPEGYHFAGTGPAFIKNEVKNATDAWSSISKASRAHPFFPQGMDDRCTNLLVSESTPGLSATGMNFGRHDNSLLRTMDKRHASGCYPVDKIPPYWGLVIFCSVLLCIGAIYINIRMS
jgi:hypothetical protein